MASKALWEAFQTHLSKGRAAQDGVGCLAGDLIDARQAVPEAGTRVVAQPDKNSHTTYR